MYLYFFLAVSSCYLFRIIHLWLPWVCRCGWLSAAAVSGLLSSCGARASHRGSGGCSLAAVLGLLIAVASPVAGRGSRAPGLLLLWCTHLVAPQHVESSRNRY